MRTRRANQAKSYTLDQYDFLGSASETEDTPSTRRRRKNDDEDTNFDQPAQEEEEEEDDAIEDADLAAEATSGSEGEGDDDDIEGGVNATGDRPKRFRPRVRPLQVLENMGTGYLDAEPLPMDTHLPRGYMGSFERHSRGKALVRAWYGGRLDGVETAARLINGLGEWTVLPPKMKPGGETRCLWKDASFFNKEQDRCEKWLRELNQTGKMTVLKTLGGDSVNAYRPESHPMPVLIGPEQTEYSLSPGMVHLSSHTDLPFEDDESDGKIAAGWMIDTGGTVTSLDWAATKHSISEAQFLALAVLPFGDHRIFNYEEEAVKTGFQKYGVVQIWEFHGEQTQHGLLRPSTTGSAKLRKTLCFDKGRARQVAWSPVCDHLAVLCTDGNVFIIKPGDGDGGYEYVQKSTACLELKDEKGAEATTVAWNGFNRITTGHKDGSVCLWSINPTVLLSRHSVHQSAVISMDTGYPSNPYLVASSPVGGTLRLVDLRSPSHEISEVITAAIVTTTGSVSWCDHLQGFFSLLPSSNALSTMIGFVHMSHFPIARRTFTGERGVTCFASGRTHPYLLVGGADGTLWSLNTTFEVVRIRREPTDRLRIFQHEHRPGANFEDNSPARARGAVRFVRGWRPEKTKHSPTADMRNPPASRKKSQPKKKGEIPDAPPQDGEDPEAAMVPIDPLRGTVYEPQTRITAVQWNPNGPFGCWAAVALGSGLVRVLDLGLEGKDGKGVR